MKGIITRVGVILMVFCLVIVSVACQPVSGDTPEKTDAPKQSEDNTTANTAAPKEQEVETIKVGCILPLSGSAATLGQECRNGFDLAIKEINDAGGIKNLGGAKIEVIYADCENDATVGMTEAERLITNEGVSILAGAYSSSVTLAIGDVSERYKVPLLVLLASANSVTESGFNYVYRINVGMGYVWSYFEEYLQFCRDSGYELNNIAIVYESSELSVSNAEVWRDIANNLGLNIVVDEMYDAKTVTDMSSLVNKIKNNDVDILWSGSYLSDMLLLAQTMLSYDVSLDMWIGGGSGEQSTEFIATLGEASEHVISPKPITIDLRASRPGFNTLCENYFALYGGEEESGYICPLGASMSYSNGYVLADVLERTASLSCEDLCAAFDATDIKDTENDRALWGMPYFEINFDENGQCWSFSCVTQIVDGSWRYCWPEELVVMTAESDGYPIMGWNKKD